MVTQVDPKAILAAAFERGQEFERGRWEVLARAVVGSVAALALLVNEEPDKERRKAARVRHALLLKVREMIPDAKRYEEEEAVSERATYWNGEPTPCERVIVQVGRVENPDWWCAPFEGQERRAVRVNYRPEADMVYLLDNEDGQGWHKVTTGMGGPQAGHKQLPDSSEILRPDMSRTCPCGKPYDEKED